MIANMFDSFPNYEFTFDMKVEALKYHRMERKI